MSKTLKLIERLHTLHVVGEPSVNSFVRLQRLLIIATSSVTACDHQLPLDLTGPGKRINAAQKYFVHVHYNLETNIFRSLTE